jgi:hypothetical protein
MPIIRTLTQAPSMARTVPALFLCQFSALHLLFSRGCPMSQALHPMLNIAIKAARAAGNLINRASLDLELLKVNTKSPNDFVTEVDQAAENVIIDTILSAYPGHGILAE